MEILTLDDLIKIYNPANAANLTVDQINAIKDLDDDQIKALSEAYPNKSMGNAYLVLYDTSKTPEKQLYSLSTWKNLKSVRDMGKKNFIPFAFRANMPSERAAAVKASKGTAGAPAAKFVDLSTEELAKLSNVKKTVGNTAKVPAAAFTKKTDTKVATPAPPAGDGKDKAVIPEGDGKETVLEPVDETHPLVIAVRTEEKELAQLNEDKAHHMTIKSQEAKVATAKEAAAAEGIIVPPAAASTEAAPEQ